ncbi:MAG: SLC13 family permease, partial [Promethearchaeota archaeon]
LPVFIMVIITIATEKINKTVIALFGAIILFIFLIFYTQNPINTISLPWKFDLENINNLLVLTRNISPLEKILLLLFQNGYLRPFQFSNLVNFMIGKEADNYNNLHSIILLLGIMIQVKIYHEAGVFQYIALKLVKRSHGNPQTLLLICCLLSVFISAILSNRLTIILLIPLTIMICRILNINPIPYILSEAILVNVGGIMFIFSSGPNILISQTAGLNFIDYLINVAWFAPILLFITYIIFKLYFKKQFKIPEKRLIQVLEEFNPWNFVPNRNLFYKSIFSLIATVTLIILLPDFLDIVAMTISLILIMISKLKVEELIKNIDFGLLLYLLGIFIITGCLEYVGVVDSIGFALKNITGGSPAGTTQVVLWSSAILSSSIDNLPIISAILPMMPILTFGFSPFSHKMSYFALGMGSNLGDNLTPMGDNILVMNLAKEHGATLKFKEFFKLGFITTIIQLACTSLFLGVFTLIGGS